MIVSKPKTGAILALAVRPTFDPNRPGTDPSLWRNRAIADNYEPGSTFKIVTAAAALEEHLFSPGDLVYGEDGKYSVENTVVHDHHKHGWMTFARGPSKVEQYRHYQSRPTSGGCEARRVCHRFRLRSKDGS